MDLPAPDVLLPAIWTLLFLAVGVLGWLYRRQHSRSRRLREDLDAAQSEIGSLLAHDALTGLATRAEFEATLDVAVRDCDHSQRALCLLVLGLDGFRQVNQACGHEVGDQALQLLGARLATAAEGGVVARLAGDEFVLLAPLPLAEARALAMRLIDVVRRELKVAGQAISLGASIGIASYPAHGSRPRLIINAGAAMRVVKLAGGGSFAEFEPSMGVDQREQFALRNDLRGALERQQFQLVYQPKVDAQSLQITAAEALLRWNHPQRGLVGPSVFIPVAERHGLINSIGDWVIEEACRQAAEWREQGLRMRVAVNLSGAQVRQDDLVPRIEAALRRHQLQPARFTCEITESVAMEDTQASQLFFERLRRAGVHVSIDDFGTGYSSLASLRRLPAAELKIDRAFVADIEGSADARSIAAAIVQMAHRLDMRVVAEGVETELQRDILCQLGCDELQGYLFAKPMSAQALALWAADDRPEAQRAFRDSLFEETSAAPLLLR